MMNINLNQIVNNLSKQYEDQPGAYILKNAFKAGFDKQKPDIEALIEAKNEGQLTAEEFELEISREKQILEAELLTQQIMAKSEVQKFVNAAFELIGKSFL